MQWNDGTHTNVLWLERGVCSFQKLMEFVVLVIDTLTLFANK